MKTNLIAALLLCSMALTANARSHRKKRAKPTISNEQISMHRTACFGRCPDYEVIVHADGLVEYHGIRFTQYTGVYQKKVSAAAAAGLIKSFAAQRIDTCKDTYEKRIPDLPGIIYNYEINGKKGQVYNADSGPMWLRVMSSKVDALAPIDATWTKISDKVPGTN